MSKHQRVDKILGMRAAGLVTDNEMIGELVVIQATVPCDCLACL